MWCCTFIVTNVLYPLTMKYVFVFANIDNYFLQLFYQMWLEEAGIVILTSSPGPMALHPLQRMRWWTPHFEGRAEYTLIGEKSLHLVGLKPATFWLQATTLTNRPLVHSQIINVHGMVTVECILSSHLYKNLINSGIQSLGFYKHSWLVSANI